MTDKYDSFNDVLKVLNGVLRITIKSKLATFGGYKKGDEVRVMVKKGSQEYEPFPATIISTNDTLRITVPAYIVKAAKYQPGDKVKVMIRKVIQ